MTCKPIHNLKLDKITREALKDLAERRKMAKALNYLLPTAITANMLSSNRALVTSYNITATDYELAAEAMTAIPRIYKNRVETISELMVLTHYATPTTAEERKLRQFWINMSYHCKMETKTE